MKTLTTFRLPVAPLPANHSEDSPESRPPLPDGFVDDDVIASLIQLPQPSRIAGSPADLVLSSDENDFAGWALPRTSPFRIIAEKQELENTRLPVVESSEPGIGQPHRGSHRWWIAAVTGVSSALILSLLFSNLADRSAGGENFTFSKPISALQAALGSLSP